MKTTPRPLIRRQGAAPSSIAAAILAASAVTLVGCSPQATPPAPAVAPTAVATAPAPQPVPLQLAPATPPAALPAQPAAMPVQPTRVGQTGRPVPNAPADFPNPPVADVPVPAQAAPPLAHPPARRVATESRPVASNRLGRVASIEPIREKPAGTGAGGVVGGVLGAVVGNRFGHGNGRAAMTVIGAAGGAFAGNSVERNVREHIVGYRVSVDLDNGSFRSFQETSPGDLQVGDRVRVEGQRLRRL